MHKARLYESENSPWKRLFSKLVLPHSLLPIYKQVSHIVCLDTAKQENSPLPIHKQVICHPENTANMLWYDTLYFAFDRVR